MRRELLFFCFVLLVSAAFSCVIADSYISDPYDTYEKMLRPYLFTSFLTVGGFILSLIAIVLFSLRKELYDSDEYKERHNQHVNEKYTSRGLTPKHNRLEPLVNLGKLLIFCVIAALITSMLQITVGFIRSPYAALFCVSFANATLCTIIFACVSVAKTLQVWFELLEKC